MSKITSFFGSTAKSVSAENKNLNGSDASRKRTNLEDKKLFTSVKENKGLTNIGFFKNVQAHYDEIVQKNIMCKYLNGISPSWYRLLQSEFSKNYCSEISKFLDNTTQVVYPPHYCTHSWSFYCEPGDVKVVIVGQDPYHNPNQAHGLSFSVPPEVRPPPSLVNIYKELEGDSSVSFSTPDTGCLVGWANQGVLMLNATLTVYKNNPNSHANIGWQAFTDKIISVLNEKYDNIVFMLWGAFAQKKGSKIDMAAHPSPFSAANGFFGCGHFSKANAYLTEKKRGAIDWNKF